jgi:hypothetical protein
MAPQLARTGWPWTDCDAGTVLRCTLEESMTPLPEVPGIIEGAMTVVQEPDGRMSFRVLISANGERTDCCDRIELIINPEHVRQALAGTEVRRLAGAQATDRVPTFPCHIGFSRHRVNSAP